MKFPGKKYDFDQPAWYEYLCGSYLEDKGFRYREHFDLNNVVELAEEVFWREVEKEAA